MSLVFNRSLPTKLVRLTFHQSLFKVTDLTPASVRGFGKGRGGGRGAQRGGGRGGGARGGRTVSGGENYILNE